MPQPASHRGLFIGAVTLDLIYLVDRPPLANQKLVASDYAVSAGGPATNAAIAFSHLGNTAIVLGVLGCHPMAQLVLTDLQQYGVTLTDLKPTLTSPPPVSSILVTAATGDRAVVSLNTVKAQAVDNSPINLQAIAIILIDGHQMEMGRQVAMEARSHGIPIVIDGGSWKPGFETVLPLADYVICSANFHPPGCQSAEAVASYLLALGVPHIAITQGQQPIQYWTAIEAGQIDVPVINVVDTLGAGDIFHGAFCHAIVREDFRDSLAIAASIAAQSCQYFGTRRWMEG